MYYFSRTNEYRILNNEKEEYKAKIRSHKRTDFCFGALEGIRTSDLPLRRRSLYPTELQAQILIY